MTQLPLSNPFNAPVYHEDTVSSTMEVSRTLARQGAAHGTVITADFQEAGRGRIEKRQWDMERGTGLACTVLLRYPRIEDIPTAMTLRIGLAVSLAIEDFIPALKGRVQIKWPNDILISCASAHLCGYKKAVGILTEADGGNVHIGIGVNVGQKSFPENIRSKATSLSLASGKDITGDERYTLLEKILAHLHNELVLARNGGPGDTWNTRTVERLYLHGEQVTFAEGAADSGTIVTGILTGIGPDGELLISVPRGSGTEAEVRSFVTGELLLEGNNRQ